jgi:hypothetical protein
MPHEAQNESEKPLVRSGNGGWISRFLGGVGDFNPPIQLALAGIRLRAGMVRLGGAWQAGKRRKE